MTDHIYQGDCPDETDMTRRDPECPACKTMEAEAARNWPDALTAISEALRNHRMLYTLTDDGDGLPLVDRLTPIGDRTIKRGNDELARLAEAIWEALPDSAAAAQQGAVPEDLRVAAAEASDYLAELYAKYQRRIGPFASQAQLLNVRLRKALTAPGPSVQQGGSR